MKFVLQYSYEYDTIDIIKLIYHGYYDGSVVIPFEKIKAKRNQRIIITIMDEFVEPQKTAETKSIRGILSKYANPKSAENEKGAWARAVVNNYDNT